MKKSIIALVAMVLLAVLGAAYWLHGNLDHLIKSGLESYGGAMTQAAVKVERVTIKPADGHGTLDGLLIGNPPGFQAPYALKVGTVELAIDLTTLTEEVIVIRRVALLAPDVMYEKGDKVTNFDVIQANITNYLGPSSKDSAGKKFIVQEFIIQDAKAHAVARFLGDKPVTADLPDLRLRDLGKAQGGLTAGELGQEVANALELRLRASLGFERLMKSIGNAIESTGDAIKGLFK